MTVGKPASHESQRTLLRNVEVDGTRCDVELADGLIVAIGHLIGQRAYDLVVDGRGGALIPGLHDHHMHVLALAAARTSVVVGPPEVATEDDLKRVLTQADRRLPQGAWMRAVGFHESVAPELDRHWLDRVVDSRPVRVQHRSGRQWILNSRAIEACRVGLSENGTAAIVERDREGRPTGRVTGADAELRRFWTADDGDQSTRALGRAVRDVSLELAGYGVTGVSDATPYETADEIEPLVAMARTGSLTQRLTIMGAPGLGPTPVGVHPAIVGPAKLVVADDAIPSIDEIVAGMRVARSFGRAVAVHCVTRVGLILCLAAFDEVGTIPGDRIEHGAIIDDDLARHLRSLGLIVVTQPNFVCERGDRYLADVEAADQPHLYPCASLLNAGIGVAGSTDAPFGHPDPWRAMRAAVERDTATGQPIGHHERVANETALKLFLGRSDAPAGSARAVRVGETADVCLLHVPMTEGQRSLTAENVRATWVGGVLIHGG